MFRLMSRIGNNLFPVTLYKGKNNLLMYMFYIIKKTYPIGQRNSAPSVGLGEPALH